MTRHLSALLVLLLGSGLAAADNVCLDEVACLVAAKPPACCSRYKHRPGPTRPPVSPGAAEKLTKTDISAGIAKVRTRVMGCSAKTSAKGTVKIAVKVLPGGTVATVTVKETPDPALGACVAGVMQKATFARTQTGGAFTYPFKF